MLPRVRGQRRESFRENALQTDERDLSEKGAVGFARPGALDAQQTQHVENNPHELSARAAQGAATCSLAVRRLHDFKALQSLSQQSRSVQLQRR
jgi:hypothetical protein